MNDLELKAIFSRLDATQRRSLRIALLSQLVHELGEERYHAELYVLQQDASIPKSPGLPLSQK